MGQLKLTTVNVIKQLYEQQFRFEAIKSGINFQKLVNRSLYLYVTNDSFRETINQCQISGSIGS